MGLFDFLKQKGIEFQGAAKDVATWAGYTPVRWDHVKRPGLIWRVPEPDTLPPLERVTLSSLIKQPILVRETERAVVLNEGKYYAEMEAGIWDLKQAPLKGTLEIVWVSVEMLQFDWGVGNVFTTDNVKVGGYGTLTVKISDASKFALGMVLNKSVPFFKEGMDEWLRSPVAGVMRHVMANSPALQLLREREAFFNVCREQLSKQFADWGLSFETIEMLELNLPPEFQHALQATGLMGDTQRKAAQLDAINAAGLRQIEAQANANASLLEGAAQVQLMTLMQASGIDPLKLKTIEALNAYGSTPSAGGLLGDPAKGQVFAALAGNMLAQSASVPPAAVPPQPALPAASPIPSTDAPLTRDQIQKTIDGLDQQLAEGKISEATYQRLVAKWEKKLAELGG
jgi:regulator of protease activity HflC (stomatin/prohibitin superfamily)